jgi:hypothetical protein
VDEIAVINDSNWKRAILMLVRASDSSVHPEHVQECYHRCLLSGRIQISPGVTQVAILCVFRKFIHAVPQFSFSGFVKKFIKNFCGFQISDICI